jgi:hypothetical protein
MKNISHYSAIRSPGSHVFNKLALVLCQKALVWVSAFFVSMLFEEKILKIFSYISKCKNSFPYWGTTNPEWGYALTYLLFYCVWIFFKNLNISISGLQKNIFFFRIFLLQTHVKMNFPFRPKAIPGPWFLQTSSCTVQ